MPQLQQSLITTSPNFARQKECKMGYIAPNDQHLSETLNKNQNVETKNNRRMLRCVMRYALMMRLRCPASSGKAPNTKR